MQFRRGQIFPEGKGGGGSFHSLAIKRMGLPSSGAEESQAYMRYRFEDLHYNALHMTFDILLGCVQN